MSPGAIARIAIPMLTLGVGAALVLGAWAWMRRLRLRGRSRARRAPQAGFLVERREVPREAVSSVDEPPPVSHGGWSLDLSDEP
jgi:hypothetical protein